MPETDFIVALGRPLRTCAGAQALQERQGVGVVGGWVQQIGNDAGGVANLTNGANGHSVGPGPLVT